MTDWQPIESAPKDGTDVLLYGRGVIEYSDLYTKNRRMIYGPGCHVGFWQDGKWATRDPAVNCEPTHWLPLPQPPETQP